jgi:hypothetical protein
MKVGPQRHEQRREVLDQQRDADREPVNRQEVEPLAQGEPGDAEHARYGTSRRVSRRRDGA